MLFVYIRLNKKPILRPENAAILRVPGPANSYGLPRRNLPSIPCSKLYHQSSNDFPAQEGNFYELDECDEISYPSRPNEQNTDC